MQKFIVGIFLLSYLSVHPQELYPYSEPASTLSAKSIDIKLTEHFVNYDRIFVRPAHRLALEIRVGLNKKFMIDIGGSFSDMHTSHFDGESIFAYCKYRFFSVDEIHRHFRMAAFANASRTTAPFHYDEIALMGDKSGVELGLIATQLWNRLALSGALSHTQLLDSSRFNDIVYIPERLYQAMNYSLSAGYLLFPKRYTNYKQVNINLYMELLAQQTLDHDRYYMDIAPAVQLIFNSNSKLNFGYRFQFIGTMVRMSGDSWLISFERSFFNGLGFLKRKDHINSLKPQRLM